MSKIQLIKHVMTPFPYSVEIDASIETAEQMMLEHNIRHLPVKQKNRVVSVVTERDIRKAKYYHSQNSATSAAPLNVADVCVSEAYIVDINERLDTVLLYMAKHHIGSTLVVKDDHLAGIYTGRDACKGYGELLRSLHPPTTPGHDAA